MRSVSKADALRATAEAAGVEVDVRALDVTDDAQARSVVDAVVADHGRIDLLVNNAGQGLVGTIEELTLDDLRAQIELNRIAVARMTKLVLGPHARAQVWTNRDRHQRRRCRGPAVQRGVLRVEVRHRAVHGEPRTGGRPVQCAGVARGTGSGRHIQRTSAAFVNAQTAAEAAVVIVEACTAAAPHLRYLTSPVAKAFAGAKLADLDGSVIQGITRKWIA